MFLLLMSAHCTDESRALARCFSLQYACTYLAQVTPLRRSIIPSPCAGHHLAQVTNLCIKKISQPSVSLSRARGDTRLIVTISIGGFILICTCALLLIFAPDTFKLVSTIVEHYVVACLAPTAKSAFRGGDIFFFHDAGFW